MTERDSIEVLLIEDNPGDARLVREQVEDIHREQVSERIRTSASFQTIEITHEPDLASGLARLSEEEIDLVLLDLHLPDSEGLDGIDSVIHTTSSIPVVVLTGMSDQRLGIEAVSRGAQDYLLKDELEPRILRKSIEYAIERKAQERELLRRSEQISILTRLMRHDVRNGVSLIVGRAQELADHIDPRGQARLEEIIHSGNHVLQLTRTIGDALDGIRTSEDEALIDVNLRSVLREQVNQAARQYRGGEITLGDVPDVDVKANRLLASVVANLINNGIFYNDKDVPHVHVDAIANEETVRIRVADNGPGIPEAQQELMFQEANRSDESAGLGVGLMLVHRLVTQYGGSITIEDNDPTGSVFAVELQRA